MSIEQLLKDSNTDWNVEKRALFGPNGEPANAYGVFRADNDDCLGVVGNRYRITQNSEVAQMLYEAADRVNITIDRGGFLNGGRKVYYQLGLPDVTIGGSMSKRFLTGLTSHDGSSPIGFGATNIVVVCANTFFQALQETSRVRHTLNSQSRMNEIVVQLQNSMFQEEQMVETMIRMSNTYIPENIEDDFLLNIIGGEEDTTRTKNRLAQVRQAMVPEFNTHGNTAYALFNAITRYTNHLINYSDIESKRNSLMSGVGFRTNTKAFDIIEAQYLTPAATIHSVM